MRRHALSRPVSQAGFHTLEMSGGGPAGLLELWQAGAVPPCVPTVERVFISGGSESTVGSQV